MALWLSRQKKGDLIDLAQAAGLPDADGMLRERLAQELNQHFLNNAARLGDDERFVEYYKRTNGSPAKRDPIEASVKKVRRTATPADSKDEAEQSEGPSSPVRTPAPPASRPVLTPGPSSSRPLAKTPAAKTPSRSSSAHLHPSTATPHHPAATIATFPPSPAVVTDAIENSTARVSEKIHDMVDNTHVGSFFLEVRDVLSSVIGIEGTILLLEFGMLQQKLMQYNYAFDIPATDRYVKITNRAVYLPDAFVLLTGQYWKSTALYLLTCFFIPLAASWFYNLTIRPTARHGTTILKPRWRCDPMTFNVVKALMVWLVFARANLYWGIFEADSARDVLLAMPAGYTGLMIGSAIGALASMYDAVQRK